MPEHNRDRLRLLFCCLCAMLAASLLRDGCLPPPPVYSPSEADQTIPEMRHGFRHSLDDGPNRMILTSPRK